jgi:hypothetical protein
MLQKIFFTSLLAMACVSCTRDINEFLPNHFGVAPGVEWEMQHHQDPKFKTKVTTSLDWNF